MEHSSWPEETVEPFWTDRLDTVPAQGAMIMLLIRKDTRWAKSEAKDWCEKVLQKEIRFLTNK